MRRQLIQVVLCAKELPARCRKAVCSPPSPRPAAAHAGPLLHYHCTMPPAGPSLQAFRLSLYVALPVAATVLYSQPSVMNQIISFFNYTVYPPAGPPPPTADEMEQLMKERRAKR